jgi:Tol biopolymer transport system component
VLTKQPDLEQVPPKVRKLLGRCLQRDLKLRLKDIGEARFLLEEAPVAQAQAENPSHQWIPWALAGALAIGAAALAFLHFREQPPERQVLQYTLAAPEKTTIQYFAVSPDGRYVVMRAAGDGGAQLWVRPLDSLKAQPLAGTDNATYPFWSPDSRYIAFFADSKLKKISVNGGPSQPLCDARTNGQGGTWNDDGVILFAVFNPGSSGIYRVPATGGVPVQVSKAETAYRLPVFLPDGRRFLYLAVGSAKENGIYMASLEPDTSPRRLMLDESGPRYFPPRDGVSFGHVLFVRDTTLMAQPVDPQTLEAKGDLFPITAEPVARGPNPGDYLYSISSQGMLAYRTGAGGAGQQLAWFDRAGKENGSVGTAAQIQSFTLTLDGKRAVTARQRGDPSRIDVWVTDPEHNTEQRITFDDSRNVFPVWSPDGSKVAFASNRSGATPNIYQRASNGTGQDELLLESKEVKLPTDWSRDGRFIIYRQQDSKTADDLYALPMTGEKKPIALVNTTAQDTQGQLSPDGRWLAYTSNESGGYAVYVQPFGPGFEKPITGKWQISTAGGTQPRWRGDGKELYYVAPDRKLMAVEIRSTATTFDRGTPQTLFESRSDVVPLNPNVWGYMPSPDGKRFLIQTAPGAAGEAPPLTVVVNWLAAVKK